MKPGTPCAGREFEKKKFVNCINIVEEEKIRLNTMKLMVEKKKEEKSEANSCSNSIV